MGVKSRRGDTKRALGKNLREARERAKLTQEAVGQRSGVHATEVCHRRGPGRGRGRLGERSVEALTTGPVPVLTQAAGDRPLLRCAYRTFTMCRSGTTESTDASVIMDHPLPLVSSRRIAGCGRVQTKENLSVEGLVSANHA